VTDQFPAKLKLAIIKPIKKAGMFGVKGGSYQPIPNLRILSKLLERMIVDSLWPIYTIISYFRQFSLASSPDILLKPPSHMSYQTF
jgi:hypothetical protein